MKKLKLGQSLFEVVVAIGLISLIIVSLVFASTISIRNATYSKNKTLASKYANEAIEWIRTQKETNIANFITAAAIGSYCFNSLSFDNNGACQEGEYITGTIFLRDVTFNSYSVSGNSVIEVDVIVSWQDGQGQHEARSITSFGDIRQK